MDRFFNMKNAFESENEWKSLLSLLCWFLDSKKVSFKDTLRYGFAVCVQYALGWRVKIFGFSLWFLDFWIDQWVEREMSEMSGERVIERDWGGWMWCTALKTLSRWPSTQKWECAPSHSLCTRSKSPQLIQLRESKWPAETNSVYRAQVLPPACRLVHLTILRKNWLNEPKTYSESRQQNRRRAC